MKGTERPTRQKTCLPFGRWYGVSQVRLPRDRDRPWRPAFASRYRVPTRGERRKENERQRPSESKNSDQGHPSRTQTNRACAPPPPSASPCERSLPRGGALQRGGPPARPDGRTTPPPASSHPTAPPPPGAGTEAPPPPRQSAPSARHTRSTGRAAWS